MEKINLKDILESKKKHPCDSNLWEVIRIGSDIKLKCQKCDRVIIKTRRELKSFLKK